MRYCPDCGTPHECEAQAAVAGDDAAVKIARIQAERDVTLAKLGARQAAGERETIEAITETEAETAVDVAIAEAVVADTILGAQLAGATEEPEPLVIEAPPVQVNTDVDTEELPPAAASPAPEPAERKTHGLGMW